MNSRLFLIGGMGLHRRRAKRPARDVDAPAPRQRVLEHRRAGQRHRITAAVVELGDLRGAKRYFDGRGRDAAATIALDGAGDERVVTRALGSRRFRVSFVGSGGHSWAAFGSPNAVHAAAGAAARLAALRLPLEPRTTLSSGRERALFSAKLSRHLAADSSGCLS